MTIHDERVRFYLRHRERIEEWAALKKEATAALDEWLDGLRPMIAETTQALGVQLNARIDPDEEWPTYQLVRPTWPLHDSGQPRVCVALQWHRWSVTLGPGEPPYVGVVCRNADPLGLALRSSDAMKTARLARNHRTTSWYAALGYVLPGPEVPDSFDEYRDKLIEELSLAWRAYAPVIDVVLANTAATP